MKTTVIPNEVFESDDRNKVAIVFERINRAGTPLNVFELLSAWSWSEEFDLVEKFAILQEKITDFGFEDLCEDKDLQLRICAGIIAGETTPKQILELKGEDIRRRFSEIENGIIGALDFLRREANVKHYKMLPFPGLLVPLSSYFATPKMEGKNYTEKQKQQLLRWFWRSLFTRRFSSDVNQRQSDDILEMSKLHKDENYEFKHLRAELKIDFQKSIFSAANANSRVLILLLNSKFPHSFLSGAKIDIEKVLKKSSQHEYHHIHPQKHLQRLGKEPNEINVLANICFLTRADNNKIKDRAPSAYVKEIDASKRSEYLENSLCPANLEELDYESFLSERASLLSRKAYELMN